MTMEPTVLLILTLLTSFLLLLVRGHTKACGQLPPGPRPLPLLGNLLQMDRRGLLNSFMRVFELFSGFLKYFPGAHKQIFKNMQEVLYYIGQSVEKHRATLDPSNPRDFIDTYLLRMEKEKSNPHTEFHHQNLIISVLSLFFAGTETTSTTLRYGFLLMLKYPRITEKVQKEVDQVTGSHRLPTLDDRTKMPYTEAVINEIQRFSDLAPIGVPHKVTKDTLFRGYLLPKNTEVYPILSSALHDPQYFEQPDTFNPDHFLDANGALKKNEAFMPFSIELLRVQSHGS